MAAPLLVAAKHVVPALPREHVHRPGLVAALDDPRRVLLLSAPPGKEMPVNLLVPEFEHSGYRPRFKESAEFASVRRQISASSRAAVGA